MASFQSATMCACAYTTIVALTAQSNNLIYTRSESCLLSGCSCGEEGVLVGTLFDPRLRRLGF